MNSLEAVTAFGWNLINSLASPRSHTNPSQSDREGGIGRRNEDESWNGDGGEGVEVQ